MMTMLRGGLPNLARGGLSRRGGLPNFTRGGLALGLSRGLADLRRGGLANSRSGLTRGGLALELRLSCDLLPTYLVDSRCGLDKAVCRDKAVYQLDLKRLVAMRHQT
ncbi:unnamed protein product [Linum trigynum]|uniref:Uncharacterized protein n=2 Tax=Linum trigynum TaxID=586398 RepID=A0AAV2GAI6_9ROSI